MHAICLLSVAEAIRDFTSPHSDEQSMCESSAPYGGGCIPRCAICAATVRACRATPRNASISFGADVQLTAFTSLVDVCNYMPCGCICQLFSVYDYDLT